MDNKTVVYAHNLLPNNSTSFVTLPPDFGYAKLREEKKSFNVCSSIIEGATAER